MRVSFWVSLSAFCLATVSPLACDKYSGTAGAVDPCCHGLAYLYPFGPEYGDQITTICDDCSDLIYFPAGQPFLFFGSSWTSVYIDSNGLFSFGAHDTTYISQAFPIQGSPLIAPYWVDVDLRGSVPPLPGYPTTNRAWYRVPSTPLAADVERVTSDVANAFPGDDPFVATVIVVATWFAVGRYDSVTDFLDTFQAVLSCDPVSNRSYVTFCYDNLNYDSASASVGTHVNAGFNAGKGNIFYSLPGANTAADTTFACGGTYGCYTFRVNGATIVPAPPSQSQSQTASTSGTPSRTGSSSATASPSTFQTPSASATGSSTRPLASFTSTASFSRTATASSSMSRSTSETATQSQSVSVASVPFVATSSAAVDSSRMLGLIVGLVVALLVVGCCCFALFFCWPGRRKRKDNVPRQPLSSGGEHASGSPRASVTSTNLAWSPLALARQLREERPAPDSSPADHLPELPSSRVAGVGKSTRALNIARLPSGRTLFGSAVTPLSSAPPPESVDGPPPSAASLGEQLIGFRRQASGRVLLPPRTVAVTGAESRGSAEGTQATPADATPDGLVAQTPSGPTKAGKPAPARSLSRRSSQRAPGRVWPRIIPPLPLISGDTGLGAVGGDGGGVKIELVHTESVVLRPVSLVKGDPTFASFSRQQREAAALAAASAAGNTTATTNPVPQQHPRAVKPRPAHSAGAKPRPAGAAAGVATSPPPEKPRLGGGLASALPPPPAAPPLVPAFTAIVGRQTLAVRPGPNALRGVTAAVRLMASQPEGRAPLRAEVMTPPDGRTSEPASDAFGHNPMVSLEMQRFGSKGQSGLM